MEMFTAEYSYELELEASKEDGIREGNFNTARRMKKANFDVPIIQEMTGLSKEEIEKLLLFL